jgi:hypothetical protein
MSTAAKLAPAIVTKDELLELADWERRYADAKKKVSSAEKELNFRRQQLAEKVLGIKTADELKRMPPEKLLKISAQRLVAGAWKLERGAPDFAFTNSNAGRYPAWAQLYVDELGETAAARIRANTPTTYSYSVTVDIAVPA